MKSLFASIKSACFFYLVIFLGQLALFFIAPPFHVSSPNQTNIPSFIKASFAKYFGLVLLLYLLWAVWLGVINRLGLRLAKAESRHKRFFSLPELPLLAAQFFFLVLAISVLFPAVLSALPLLDRVPLFATYVIFFGGVISSIRFALDRRQKNFLRQGVLVLWTFIPFLFLLPCLLPSRLNLPQASSNADPQHPDVLLLSFDALDGDSGNQAIASQAQNLSARIYRNAFTPLPLTHPAWNSILSGLYPRHHGVRFFFDSPHPAYPAFALPTRLRDEGRYATLFASDQPETSYFNQSQGFDDSVFFSIGWEAHLSSMVFNHFVLPAVWLNNGLVDKVLGHTINSPSLFNYDMARFFNFSFEKLNSLDSPRRFTALHSCYLHTPVRLTLRELSGVPNYWKLSPRNFSFWKWPPPGKDKATTPQDWVNPYFVRREKLLTFIPQLLKELQNKNYLKNDLTVLLSDHGERFGEKHEIYGGIHGIDLKTRAQNNVVFAMFHPRFQNFQQIDQAISLIDLAPTVLSMLGLEVKKFPYDGQALFDRGDLALAVPPRSLWIESMGWLHDEHEKDELSQISIKSLEESLNYHPNGAVTIGEDYYERVIQKKESVDISRLPEMFLSEKKPDLDRGTVLAP